MKYSKLTSLLLILAILSCNEKTTQSKIETKTKIAQPSLKNDTSELEKENTSNEESLLKGEFKNFEIFNLSDTIKVDLNGDKILDFAYLSKNDAKQMFIIDGQSKITTKIGLDESFGNMGSSFNWVDSWGTTNDKETFEIIIEDNEIIGDGKIELTNTSLFVRKNEAGGGVITFKNGKYIWVHQSD